jgi:hypothetical protein
MGARNRVGGGLSLVVPASEATQAGGIDSFEIDCWAPQKFKNSDSVSR